MELYGILEGGSFLGLIVSNLFRGWWPILRLWLLNRAEVWSSNKTVLGIFITG